MSGIDSYGIQSEKRTCGVVATSLLDIQLLFQEAKHRWLRPIEVCEIIRNYQQLKITAEAPTRPPGGSIYLFDRKALRFFRKDGHRWRKKKDGKTVREAHEKLKAGSVDVLHCYYAHGEDNENFQRRSYWMLEAPMDHIVLVHYRDVKQAYKGSVSNFQYKGSGTQGGFPVANSFSWLPHDYSPLAASDVQSAFHLSQMNVIWNSPTPTPPSVFVTGNTLSYPDMSSFTQSGFTSISHDQSTTLNKIPGSLVSLQNRHVSDVADSQTMSLTVSPGVYFPNQVEARVDDSLCRFKQPKSGEGDFIPKITDNKLDTGTTVPDMALGYELKSDVDPHAPKAFHDDSNHSNEDKFRKFDDIQVISSTSQVENSPCKEASADCTHAMFQKLDSFGRWMNNELGNHCDDSLMASDSGKYWSGLDNEDDGIEVSSLSHHMHLDVNCYGPSLNQEQLFTICDFSPDWAYSGTDTKVLITGTFLVDSRRTSGTKWSCMFGEVEVCAERLTEHVLRCQAPSHDPGHVPFYVTCSNRLACSEIREFHYRENPNKPVPVIDFNVEDEVYIQVRLAKLLCSVKASKQPGCSDEKCDKCQITQLLFSMWKDRQCEWTKIEENISLRGKCIADLVMQRLLEHKLYEWLIFKLHEGGTGVHYLDKLGQGVIHLAAALGYEWAMRPIITAGISPNFRDAGGRTGLHWASYYGREESVIALVKLGAAAGAVEDPTPGFPGGSKAADLASTRGYKGIAGYLAEADLISHLSSMTINSHANGPATTPAQNVSPAADQCTISSIGFVEEVSLKKSLDAVRNSAHAVASIHSMFRSLSLKRNQSVRGNNDISKAPLDLVLAPLLNVQKVQHFDDYLHVAAEKLQNKYRAWKKRQEFLKMRSRIVKIQAHYRGHQVRKQYKKVIWSVGIVEKAILRWRRKGSGLRGFRVSKEFETISPDKIDEYEFLRIGRAQKFAGLELALSRVKSMSRNPAARDQYMRLLSTFENFKIDKEA